MMKPQAALKTSDSGIGLRSAFLPLFQSILAFALGIVRGSACFRPGVDLGKRLLQLVSNALKRDGSEDEVLGRVFRFDSRDDGLSRPHWIAWLLAAIAGRGFEADAHGLLIIGDRRTPLFQRAACPVGPKGPGLDASNPDAERGNFPQERIGQAFYRMFSGGIIPRPFKTDETGLRRDVDNVPAPSRPHPWQDGPDHGRQPKHVGFELVADFRVGSLLDC